MARKKKDVVAFAEAALDDALEATLDSGDNPVNMAELAVELIRLFGGPKGIAAAMHKAYKDPLATQSERSTIMQLMYKVVAFASSKEGMLTDEVSDEDLEIMFRKQLHKQGITGFIGEWMYHVCI